MLYHTVIDKNGFHVLSADIKDERYVFIQMPGSHVMSNGFDNA